MTDDWHARQREHLFLTWTAQRVGKAFEIDRAEGARFHVPDEGWKLDFESQVYNVNVGHGHPHVLDRMREQLASVSTAAPNVLLPIREELARRLCELTGMARVFLATGGSEATENAIKIARLATGRAKIVARRQSYHGATLSVLGIAGDYRRDPFAEHLPPPVWIDDPYPPRPPGAGRPSDWVESLERLLVREGPETVAAILLEGFTGTNGMQIPPADFWPRVRELCDAHGILLIDDEVFSGFGRTGRWFACQHWGVTPDMMVLGKGLTSGYAPLSAVAVSEDLSTHFEDHKLWCGLTVYAHPVSCAAAMGSIEALEQDGLVAHASAMGVHVQERLARLRTRRSDRVVDARGLGLMWAVELAESAGPVATALWRAGVFVPWRDRVLFLCPPLCIRPDELDRALGALDLVLGPGV